MPKAEVWDIINDDYDKFRMYNLHVLLQHGPESSARGYQVTTTVVAERREVSI